MNETSISRFLGGLIILIVGVMIFNYMKTVKSTREQITADSTEASQSGVREYTVKSGDSLWSIAQNTYGSGYKWVDIASANKEVISNPSLISTGTKISLPNLEQKITSSYTVVRGDNLWDIATKKCGNGFAWTSIAVQNNLVNPRLIHAGNILTITCPSQL